METDKDALSPLHPPAPTAPPVVDASHDSEHDPRRLKFEQIKHMPAEEQYISLSALIEEFIAAGHNPRDPRDLIFQILGITPEFLEAMLFAMKAKVPVTTIPHNPATAPDQKPSTEQSHVQASEASAEEPPAPAKQAVS